MEQSTRQRSMVNQAIPLAARSPCLAAREEGVTAEPLPPASRLFGEPRCLLPEDRWAQIGWQLPLSDREMQIIQRLFEGAQEGEIAGALGISVHTVHTHLGRIYRKLGVRSLPGMLLRVFGVYVNAVEQDAAGFSGGCSASDPSRARQEAVPARAAPTTARNDVTAPSRSRLG